MEYKNNVNQSSPSSLVVDNDDGCLCPVTPYSNIEIVNSTSKCISPSTSVSSPMNKVISNDGPCTPMEDVFGPLARGTENLMLSSNCIKNIGKSGSYVARRLNFNSKGDTHECVSENKLEDGPIVGTEKCVSENNFEDGSVLETVYESILEDIITKQAEDVLAEIVNSDVLMTPKNVARISGIAETCPGAPKKRVAVKNYWNVAASSIRKLEF